MKRHSSLLATWLLCFASLPAIAYPVGKSAFMFEASPHRNIEVLVYQPKNFGPNSPIQFVMHGISRNADVNRQRWIEIADRHGVLIVAPKFSKHLYKHATDYTLGGKDFSKVSEMTIAVVEKLFDRVKKDTGNLNAGYRIYGHSAGAQFVERLVLLFPDNRVEAAVAANAGWYTLPEWRATSSLPGMPYSTKDLPGAEARLRQAFGRHLIIMLGDKDIDPNHMQLEHGAEVDQQGVERFSRGKHFFAMAEAAARTLGVKSSWELKIEPGVDHDGKRMTVLAAELLYGKMP